MTVVALLDVRFGPDDLQASRAALKHILDETRAFDGCEGVEVVVDGQDPHHLVVVERWASPEADAAYRAFRAGPGATTALRPHLAGAPTLTKGEVDRGV